MSSQRALPPRLAIPTVLFYAAGYPIGSVAVGVMSPFLVIALRFAISAALLWIVVLARRTPMPDRRSIVHAMVAGSMTQGVQFLGLYWALAHGVSPGLGALVIALNPVLTATLMAVVLGHRESRRGLAALALATAAVVLACAPRIAAEPGVGVGLAVAVVAVVGLAAGGVYQGRFCADMDVWLLTALGLTASTPFAVILAAANPVTVTSVPAAIGILVVMVLIGSIGATTLYSASVKAAGARAASILFAIIPSAATVMAWIALDDSIHVLTIAGLLVGAAACLLQSGSTHSAEASEEPIGETVVEARDQSVRARHCSRRR